MLERYQALAQEVEATIVEKKSKFICNLIPVTTEEEAAEVLLGIKKKHYDARHHCFAYILYQNGQSYERFNDDGEPSGTAGKPMLEVLKGTGMANLMAVVTRYFGGTLLGTGGLIKAYTESVQEAVKDAETYVKYLGEMFQVRVDYSTLPKLEFVTHKLDGVIDHTTYDEKVTLCILVEKSKAQAFVQQFTDLTNGQGELAERGTYYISKQDGRYLLEKVTSN